MEPDYEREGVTLYCADVLEAMRELPDGCVRCCVTSPPYWGLRDYGTGTWEGGDPACDHRRMNVRPDHSNGTFVGRGAQGHATSCATPFRDICGKCGARRVDRQIGLEPTPEAYAERMVAVFREVRRVLADDGTLWLNLGDSYCSGDKHGAWNRDDAKADVRSNFPGAPNRMPIHGLKPKDLIGIPWRVALALQADGWWLRQDIVWHKCLSGGTWLYARTQKGDMPVMLKDLARLPPSSVQLWNGLQWTQVLEWTRLPRKGTEIEIVLRSGERIACTPEHRFRTGRGLLEAGDLLIGDRLVRMPLPEPEHPADCAIDEDAAWFAGLYLAEGSMAGDTIQISGHRKEEARWQRVLAIVTRFGGSATRTIDGNGMAIRVYGKVLRSILAMLVTGRGAKDKGIAPVAWRYSNAFLRAYLEGYLSGDGHWDADNNRWRLGFTRNYNLERDLRTACARLGWHLVLNPSHVTYKGRKVPTFRGELRMQRTGHHNECSTTEVVEIRKSRCRYVYDVCVADEPHIFALASGVMTHNSNPMPESVTDRCTKAHEFIFLLSKQARYYFDQDAIKERTTVGDHPRRVNGQYQSPGQPAHRHLRKHGLNGDPGPERRNRRSVWTIPTQPYPEAHFATFPEKLVEPCILAGSAEGDTVLDLFAGSGTTLAVAVRYGRRGIGIELNPEYCTLARARIDKALDAQGLFRLPATV